MHTIDIQEKFSKFSDHWHPHQIAVVDEMQVLLAKIKDEFVWHTHEEEDELFFVQKGILEMQFRDRVEVVGPGQMIVVPKGVEHCPRTRDGEVVELLLFEKVSTRHTGDVVDERTRSFYPKI